jgi:copper(I)-binding protein
MRSIGLLVACVVGTACGRQAPPVVADATATIVADGTAAMVDMTITAVDDDELIGAAVRSSIGGQVVVVNPDSESDPSHLGHLDPGGSIAPPGHSHAVRLPAGVVTQLGGDGPRITIGRLDVSLAPGDEFDMVLSFSRSADVTVTVLVVDSGGRPR